MGIIFQYSKAYAKLFKCCVITSVEKKEKKSLKSTLAMLNTTKQNIMLNLVKPLTVCIFFYLNEQRLDQLYVYNKPWILRITHSYWYFKQHVTAPTVKGIAFKSKHKTQHIIKYASRSSLQHSRKTIITKLYSGKQVLVKTCVYV